MIPWLDFYKDLYYKPSWTARRETQEIKLLGFCRFC